METARATAHVDSFAREHLPPPASMPEVLSAGPSADLRWLNAADVLLDRHVREGRGERLFILAPKTRWSYSATQDAANRIARVLTDEMALKPGNRVLLRAPNTPMLAACWFAVLKAGGIVVTTMPLYRASELGQIAEKARVTHALCDERLREELERGCPGVRTAYFGGDAPAPESLEARMACVSPEFDTVQTAADDIAIIAFTSGTTGKPKAAMHFHRDLLACCETYAARVLQPHPNDLFCGSPPLAFTFGLGGLLLFPAFIGATTLLLEKAGPIEMLDAIATYGVTTIFTAPVAYRTMLGKLQEYDVRSLRACVSAGETLPASIWEEWRAKTGLRILDGIGSTEMLHIFVGSPADEARPGSTGRAVPGYVAEIHDEQGRSVADGNVGRLAVKGPTGCKYLDDPRQQSYVSGGWNYPGDAYRRDADGYFWYVARIDDMIVSSGYNISGPEVEQALIAHPDVKEVAVVGKRDAARETNIVKAFMVLADGCGGGDAKAEELREFCKAQIAPFKAPREIEFVAELPRTETGKLQRYKLRE